MKAILICLAFCLVLPLSGRLAVAAPVEPEITAAYSDSRLRRRSVRAPGRQHHFTRFDRRANI